MRTLKTVTGVGPVYLYPTRVAGRVVMLSFSKFQQTQGEVCLKKILG